MNTAGVMTQDVRVKRILGLATQKFLSDLTMDSVSHSKSRMNKKGKGGKLTLQMVEAAYLGRLTGRTERKGPVRYEA
jgi:Transcription initiation factor TFIID 23-30kDa subunit